MVLSPFVLEVAVAPFAPDDPVPPTAELLPEEGGLDAPVVAELLEGLEPFEPFEPFAAEFVCDDWFDELLDEELDGEEAEELEVGGQLSALLAASCCWAVASDFLSASSCWFALVT